MGVFQYSHEENTHAADVMEDNVPKQVKEERFKEIMVLQQKINFEKNKDLVNTNQKVLIDVVKDGMSLGRTFRDSPQIDNYVKIHQNLEIGKFYNIHVTSSEEYDLTGKVV